MTSREQLIEQHIREFESRQSHIDELLEKARAHATRIPVVKDDLISIEGKYEKLLCDLHEIKRGNYQEHAIEAIKDAGPMGVWFGLVSELESLIENLED